MALTAADLARLRAAHTGYLPATAVNSRTGATIPVRVGDGHPGPRPEGIPAWQRQPFIRFTLPYGANVLKGDTLNTVTDVATGVVLGSFYMNQIQGPSDVDTALDAEGIQVKDALGVPILPFIATDTATFLLPNGQDTITAAPVFIDRVTQNTWTDALAVGYDFQVVFDVNLRYPSHPTVWPDENHQIVTPYVRAAGHTAILGRAALYPGPLAVRIAHFKEIA